MAWDSSRNAYTFTTEEADPVTIIWTPDSTGEHAAWNTGNQNLIRIPNPVIVDPLPENTRIDATVSPAAEEKDFADYILILPLPYIPPIYVYLSESKASFAHGYKHHPPKNKSWKEVIDSTKTGPAKFKQGADIASIDRDVWETGTPTTNAQNWKVKEFDSVQGAYKGKETSWVVTKESQGTIHSHPIDSEVARKLLK